jgi:putative addiction module component (TIGR02574 family)
VTDTKLIADLLALSPKRRAKIAGILLRSLDDEEDVDGQEVEDAWAKEIERRVEDIRSGKVKTVPGNVFIRKLRTKVKRARRSAK